MLASRVREVPRRALVLARAVQDYDQRRLGATRRRVPAGVDLGRFCSFLQQAGVVLFCMSHVTVSTNCWLISTRRRVREGGVPAGADPIPAVRAPLLLTLAALDCVRRPLEVRSKIRTNWRDIRSAAVRVRVRDLGQTRRARRRGDGWRSDGWRGDGWRDDGRRDARDVSRERAAAQRSRRRPRRSMRGSDAQEGRVGGPHRAAREEARQQSAAGGEHCDTAARAL